MPTDDVIPTTEAAFATWFANYAAKAPAYNTILSIPAGDLTRIAAAVPFVAAIFDAVEQARAEAKEWTAYKHLTVFGSDDGTTPAVPGAMPPAALSPIKAGLIEFLRGVIGRMKKNANYTAVIGADLGIDSGASPAPALPKPTGSVAAMGNFEARVKFKKGGFTGVQIWGQRAGETAWVLIATDSYSPYVDNRPPLVPGQPEERRYRLRYLDKDEVVGEFSDVFSCVVGD